MKDGLENKLFIAVVFDKHKQGTYKIFLVNNSSVLYSSVTTSSGSNLSQDDKSPAVMDIGIKTYGSLKPRSFIELEEGDIDWLDDHIWSQMLLKDKSGKITKKFFEIGGLAFVLNYSYKKKEKIPVFKDSGCIVELRNIK